ncbi:glycine cleavage system aminomethyltransferase GcvT [Paenibacillus sp. MMS18-CY102]|uniref:glycine cleavage system aminomethyltransferase GcvT n=1 Tax=Paenibacillus sp. MMS18-CY102 TaxID=2682849 RepID=UPI0013662D92|nr:glycine cleavage system aminomethyltransferase GcvT [Paenibacillus sp. MMS18-CY102]MWC26880.1 glycine cleavage system aminomethyltransferase GcvT [Paenibacillus sp. MMS18-CY102]
MATVTNVGAPAFARVTPYYQHHLRHGAQMMEKGGWIRPAVYTSIEEEVRNTREHVGIIDVHSMGKFEVLGKDAFAFMQMVMTNDLNRIKRGEQGIYTCLCNDEGGIVDDVVVYYLNDERFYFITNTVSRDRVGPWLNEVKARLNHEVEIVDVTNATAYLAIQGPKSLQLMTDLFGEEIQKLNYFDMLQTDLGNVPVLLCRTGYTGELGYELNYPSEYAYQVWSHVEEHGQAYHIKPVGGGAIQTLRSEKAYRSHGTDMTEVTNPFEAGIEWTVRFNKPAFIGKEALLAIKESGVEKKIRGFEIPSGALLEKGTPLFTGEEQAGYLTTCYYSPTLAKTIALGYVVRGAWDVQQFQAGTERIAVETTPIPFYDPKGLRVKGLDQAE